MPRNETTTRTLYKFDELSDEAKEKAIEANRDRNVFDDWHEYTLDLWKKVLASIGFDDAEIYFRGFWSQGDGAAFEPSRGCRFDLEKLIAYLADEPEPCESLAGESDRELQAWLNHKLKRQGGKDNRCQWLNAFCVTDFFSIDFCRVNHRYNHENSHTLTIDGYSGRDSLDEVMDELAVELDELRRDICQAIYKDLESEYDYLTSDEAISEHLSDSEDEFTEDGEPA